MAGDKAKRPNIVLIVADDLGYGDLGCYGAKDIRTPHLDRMARQGTRFTSFYVAQPVCTASRAAIMTGCYPNRVGLEGALNHTSPIGIHPKEVLLPQLLKRLGYATAIFGKWHLGHHTAFLPTNRGFDQFAGLPYSNDNGPLHPTVKGIPPLPWYEGDKIVSHDPDQSQFTRIFTERAVSFIHKNKDRPFFLYLPHVMPHVPIFASEKFKGKSERGLYGDVVQELDWGVGEVLKALKDAGVDDETLVIFMSDNGPFLSYGDHAGLAGIFREGKLTVFDGGVRVPCIVRWPGKVPAERTSEELFTGLDLLPTIAKLAGADLPEVKRDGIDLSPLVLGKPGAKGRGVFYCYSGRELHGVRKGTWKLHVPHDYLTVAGAPGKNGKPSEFEKAKPIAIEQSGIRGIASRHGYRVEKIGLALFDLKTDPGERHDVAAQNPEVVRELMSLIEAARDDLGDAITNRPGKNVRPAGDVRTK
jgi:arylsulfatase